MSSPSSTSSSLFDFILDSRVLTLAVLCSLITMQLITSFKINLLDPLIDFAVPEEKIDFLNVTIRDGIGEQRYDTKKLTLDFGQALKSFLAWLIMIFIIYIIWRQFETKKLKNVNSFGTSYNIY